MFLHVSVILLTGGGVLSQHALQVVSQHALQQGGTYSWGVPGPGEVPGLGGAWSRGCLLKGGCVAFCYGLLVWWPSD